MTSKGIAIEEITGGWAATKGKLTAHGQTKQEAVERLEAVLRLVRDQINKESEGQSS